MNETVTFFLEFDVRQARGSRYELMTVENDLRAEWGMPAHLDGEVSPLCVPDMK
jgi:hypothetical protein